MSLRKPQLIWYIFGDKMSIYQCEVCGFIYDENKGFYQEEIAPGTKWEDIDSNWVCPDCGVKKNRFKKKL